MFSATYTRSIAGDLGRPYSKATAITAEARLGMQVVIGASATTLVGFPLDVSQAKLFALRSDKALVVKVNSSGSPTNTFTLAAGVAFIWANPEGAFTDTASATVSTDFVSFYVVNAGAEATLEIDALVDPTV